MKNWKPFRWLRLRWKRAKERRRARRFRDGFEWGMGEYFLARTPISRINMYLESARDFGDFDMFDRGLEQAVGTLIFHEQVVQAHRDAVLGGCFDASNPANKVVN